MISQSVLSQHAEKCKLPDMNPINNDGLPVFTDGEEKRFYHEFNEISNLGSKYYSMFTKQFFDLLLNLDEDWQVVGVAADYKAEEISINIKYVSSKALCPDSMEMCKIYDRAPLRKWRHLDTMQYKTYITCRLPRMKNEDGKVVTVAPPWASKHDRHTYLFEHAAIDLLLGTKNTNKVSMDPKWAGWYDLSKRRPNNGFPTLEMLDKIESAIDEKW